MPNLASRTRDAERTRTAVIDAAEGLFAVNGYEATSLAAVGVRAGVSRGTPGYFFGSKADLYRAVVERAFADALDAVRSGRTRALRSGRPASDVLAGAVSDYVDFVAEHPAFVQLVQRHALGDGPTDIELPLSQAVGSEAVDALIQELGYPARARTAVMHVLLSLVALTWFPQLHANTLVTSIGFNPRDPRFVADRKRHVTTLLLAALPPQRPARKAR